MHMFFLLFAVLALFWGWHATAPGDSGLPSWVALASLGILSASVLLHEAGHAWAATRRGGYVREIVLGPLGGLGSISGLEDPRSELSAHLAGPLANLLIAAVCLPVLIGMAAWNWGLLAPLSPTNLLEGSPVVVTVKLVFWINWVVFLVNLLPAFPFDGGRALRAALLLRWPRVGRRVASLIVAGVAKATALLIAAAAITFPLDDIAQLPPPKFALLLLAIFLFFSAKHEEARSETDPFDEGLDFASPTAQDFVAREREVPEAAHVGGPVPPWLEQRSRSPGQRESEEEEERRLDEVLARVHREGMAALSNEDRALLARMSVRYRNRKRG